MADAWDLYKMEREQATPTPAPAPATPAPVRRVRGRTPTPTARIEPVTTPIPAVPPNVGIIQPKHLTIEQVRAQASRWHLFPGSSIADLAFERCTRDAWEHATLGKWILHKAGIHIKASPIGVRHESGELWHALRAMEGIEALIHQTYRTYGVDCDMVSIRDAHGLLFSKHEGMDEATYQLRVAKMMKLIETTHPELFIQTT